MLGWALFFIGLAFAVVGMTDKYLPERLRPFAEAYAFILASIFLIAGLIFLGISFHESYVLRSPLASNYGMRWPIARRPIAPFGVSEQLFKTQIAEMEKLQELIGDKSEDELRELFDYPNMLRSNISVVKKSLAPKLMSSKETADLDQYNRHAKGFLSLSFGRLVRPENEQEPLRVIPDPGQTVMINISDKYIAAETDLASIPSRK
jgi:hypothetical protein